jgi:hypothetical protein
VTAADSGGIGECAASIPALLSDHSLVKESVSFEIIST